MSSGHHTHRQQQQRGSVAVYIHQLFEIDYSGVNQPIERCNKILEVLEAPQESNHASSSSSITDMEEEEQQQVEFDIRTSHTPKEVNVRELLRKVHMPNMLYFLEHAFEEWNKCDSDFDSGDGGLIPYHFMRRTKSNLTQSQACPVLWKNVGMYAHDMATPIYENTWKMLYECASCAISGANELAHGNKYQTVYSLCALPGHHSSKDSYGGYCYLNFVAIAAEYLLNHAHASRIAIIDLDYHHGDGTQAIFYETAQVLTISLHCDPAKEYPSFTGYADEEGEGDGLHYNVNVPIQPGANLADYQQHLAVALSRVRDYNPDYLLISFGCDTVKGDPDASVRGGFQLEVPEYAQVGSQIRAACPDLGILVVQEGGYLMSAVGNIVAYFLQGLSSPASTATSSSS